MSKIKVLVLGGNGFTGKFVCKELQKRKIDFCCLIKENSDMKWLKKNKINFIIGNINNKENLIDVLEGCNFVINTASLAFINVENLISCCEFKNIERILCISSTSIFTKLNVKSKKIRIEAENKIIKSNLKWTILRPTMIFGTPDDRNIIKIIHWINKYPIIPIPGNGKALQRPIYVKDLSWAVVESLLNKKAIKKIINISGKDYITYISMIRLIEKKMRRNIFKLYIDKTFSIIICRLLEFLNLPFPLKSEQIRRINEDKLFLNNEAIDIIKYSPIAFEKAIDKEIKLYKKSFKKK